MRFEYSGAMAIINSIPAAGAARITQGPAMNEKNSTEMKPPVEAALRMFAAAVPMEQKIRALKALMKGGAVHSVRDDPRFANGVEDAVREVRSAVNPRQKLLALTVLARIASRMKVK
jgi:hypothetical protein